jgi:hypothetical protein
MDTQNNQSLPGSRAFVTDVRSSDLSAIDLCGAETRSIAFSGDTCCEPHGLDTSGGTCCDEQHVPQPARVCYADWAGHGMLRP